MSKSKKAHFVMKTCYGPFTAACHFWSIKSKFNISCFQLPQSWRRRPTWPSADAFGQHADSRGGDWPWQEPESQRHPGFFFLYQIQKNFFLTKSVLLSRMPTPRSCTASTKQNSTRLEISTTRSLKSKQMWKKTCDIFCNNLKDFFLHNLKEFLSQFERIFCHNLKEL